MGSHVEGRRGWSTVEDPGLGDPAEEEGSVMVHAQLSIAHEPRQSNRIGAWEKKQ